MAATPDASPAGLSAWMSASAALFFLLMLTVYSGYSAGAVLLLLGAVASWWMARSHGNRLPPGWNREDRILCWLLLAVFAINAAAVAWHADAGKYLEPGTRYLLVIPILYGARRATLRFGWIVAGLALGTAGAAVIAAWQTRWQGLERATGFVTSAIPFGDMALLMGFWCLMLAVLAALRQRRLLAVLLLAAGLAGAYAVIASATRGSLVALPGCALLAAIALLRRRYLRLVLVGSAVTVAALAIVFATLPAGKVAEGRYDNAFTEWQQYTQAGVVADNNVGSRLAAWKAALASIPERPLLGWGHAEYEAHLQELIRAGRADPFVATLANTHNQFIEVWLHQGITGLVALLALLITSFWWFARRLLHADPVVRVLACCGASLPAAFAAYGLTQVILGRNNGVMFFLVSLVIGWAALRQVETAAADQCA